jgi:hypothetical protein
MEVSNAEGGEIGTYAKKQSNNTTAVTAVNNHLLVLVSGDGCQGARRSVVNIFFVFVCVRAGADDFCMDFCVFCHHQKPEPGTPSISGIGASCMASCQLPTVKSSQVPALHTNTK